MGCCAAKPRDTIRNPVPQPTSQAPQPQPYQPPKPPQSSNNPQPSHYSYQKQYISPPSVIAKPAQPQPQPPKPIPQAPNDQSGYPDVLNYGNANKNYLQAAGRKAEDVLHDEDIGYYAANGRNVSMRVDMNH